MNLRWFHPSLSKHVILKVFHIPSLIVPCSAILCSSDFLKRTFPLLHLLKSNVFKALNTNLQTWLSHQSSSPWVPAYPVPVMHFLGNRYQQDQLSRAASAAIPGAVPLQQPCQPGLRQQGSAVDWAGEIWGGAMGINPLLLPLSRNSIPSPLGWLSVLCPAHLSSVHPRPQCLHHPCGV